MAISLGRAAIETTSSLKMILKVLVLSNSTCLKDVKNLSHLPHL